MRRYLVAFAAFAGFLAVASTPDTAQAAWPCGEGLTLQDGVCKPYYGPAGRSYRHSYRHYRRGKPCPGGYTLQDGVCKPYRGPWRRRY